MAYWPPDGKCYTLHTRGPCSRGKLLNWGKDRLAECSVSYSIEDLLNLIHLYDFHSVPTLAYWPNTFIALTSRVTSTIQEDRVTVWVSCFFPVAVVAAMLSCRITTKTQINAMRLVS